MRTKRESFLEVVAIVLVVILWIALFVRIAQLTSIGKQNNTYLRTQTCITSEVYTNRTADYVKSCYDEAEKHNNVTIDRFGTAKPQ